MKFMLATLALTLSTSSFAISRYHAPDYTCGEIKQLVKDEGAVILRYPSTRVPGLTLYDRYVKNSFYCDSGEETAWAYVPSLDQSKCKVYRCVRRDR